MCCRMSKFFTISLCVFQAAVLISVSTSSTADSVIVKGKRYDNIYLAAGANVYYIQNPADGSMVTVPKADVREKDISITPDREQRRKLRDRWRQQRLNKTFETPSTAAPESSLEAPPEPLGELAKDAPKTATPPPASRSAVKPIERPVVISSIGTEKKSVGAVIGNIPQRNGLSGRKIFMDAQGTPVLTNTPENFSGRPEYVEVTLHYEQIDVPERFRAASATPAPASAHAKKRVSGADSVDDIVRYYAGRYAIDETLVYAIIRAESNGNRYAVSPAGARGLMQLMPGTAREMGVKDIFDPAENIAGGTQYLAKLLNLFNNDATLALAGYNAGPGNVQKYDGVPPFKETQDYVRRVKQYQRQLAKGSAPRLAMDSSKPVDKDYLPPDSKNYYMIVLDNGLTVAAEQVYAEDGRYIYTFKGRSGHFAQSAVLRVIEPS